MAAFAVAFTAATAQAQTTVTLDGTSGSESISTSYTVDNGGLEIDLAFTSNTSSSAAAGPAVRPTPAAVAEALS